VTIIRKEDAPESNLNAEFHKWFSGSKVLDKSGNPRIVYHGSNKSRIDVFDKKLQGQNYGSFTVGFHFAESQIDAKKYADEFGSGQVQTFYLRVLKPLILDFDRQTRIDKAIPELKDIYPYCKKHGFDGVKYRHSGIGAAFNFAWLVFEPDQIKSTENNGKWDPSSEDVFESK
jgi:hypothetical protein